MSMNLIWNSHFLSLLFFFPSLLFYFIFFAFLLLSFYFFTENFFKHKIKCQNSTLKYCEIKRTLFKHRIETSFKYVLYGKILTPKCQAIELYIFLSEPVEIGNNVDGWRCCPWKRWIIQYILWFDLLTIDSAIHQPWFGCVVNFDWFWFNRLTIIYLFISFDIYLTEFTVRSNFIHSPLLRSHLQWRRENNKNKMNIN